MLAKILTLTNDLIRMEEAGSDATEIGRSFAALIPEDMVDGVLDLLEAPDWLARVVAINPRLKGHEPYVTLVRDAVLAEFEPDASQEENSAVNAGQPVS